jgi:serine/threonine-protein kinase RsbW
MPDPSANPPDRDAVTLCCERAAIDAVQDRVLAAAERRGYSRESIFAVRLAMEEAISNAFRHGHKDLPPQTPITVEYEVTDDYIRIAVQDRGPGFRPETIKDPTLEENIEEPSGRGLMLMRAFMAMVRYNEKGNRVELLYRRPVQK